MEGKEARIIMKTPAKLWRMGANGEYVKSGRGLFSFIAPPKEEDDNDKEAGKEHHAFAKMKWINSSTGKLGLNACVPKNMVLQKHEKLEYAFVFKAWSATQNVHGSRGCFLVQFIDEQKYEIDITLFECLCELYGNKEGLDNETIGIQDDDNDNEKNEKMMVVKHSDIEEGDKEGKEEKEDDEDDEDEEKMVGSASAVHPELAGLLGFSSLTDKAKKNLTFRDETWDGEICDESQGQFYY